MTKLYFMFYLALAILLSPSFTSISQAADKDTATLSIRLVRAGVGQEIDPQLKDVAALMKGNLAFSSFKLLETKTVTLPASAPVKIGRNYKIALNGPPQNLDITISQGAQVLIKTHVVLKGQSPLVLGGIGSRDGTILFVLNLVK